MLSVCVSSHHLSLTVSICLSLPLSLFVSLSLYPPYLSLFVSVSSMSHQYPWRSISLYMSLYVCVSFLCLPVSSCLCMSASVCLCLSLCLFVSVCLSIYHLSLSVPVMVSVCLYLSVYVCVSIFLSLSLSLSLSRAIFIAPTFYHPILCLYSCISLFLHLRICVLDTKYKFQHLHRCTSYNLQVMEYKNILLFHYYSTHRCSGSNLVLVGQNRYFFLYWWVGVLPIFLLVEPPPHLFNSFRRLCGQSLNILKVLFVLFNEANQWPTVSAPALPLSPVMMFTVLTPNSTIISVIDGNYDLNVKLFKEGPGSITINSITDGYNSTWMFSWTPTDMNPVELWSVSRQTFLQLR